MDLVPCFRRFKRAGNEVIVTKDYQILRNKRIGSDGKNAPELGKTVIGPIICAVAAPEGTTDLQDAALFIPVVEL
jgi:hypothetical protein